MALIFSPITEDVLEGPYKPLPKTVFLMIQLGDGRSRLESDMQIAVSDVIARKNLTQIDVTTERSQKDYLDKIIKLIRG